MINTKIEKVAGRFFIPAALCIVLCVSVFKVIKFTDLPNNIDCKLGEYIEGYVYDSCTFGEDKLVLESSGNFLRSEKILLLTYKLDENVKNKLEKGGYIKIKNPEKLIKKAKTARNFGEFDQRQYLASKNIKCQLLIGEGDIETVIDKKNFSIVMANVRKSIFISLEKTLGRKNASTAMAVITGDTSYLENEDLQSYRDSGIAHIMAVSGMHVAFVQSGVAFILSRIKMNYAAKKIVTIAVLVLFGGIADFSPSVTRVLLQSVYMLTAKVIRRPAQKSNALFSACILQLLYNPYLLFSSGFVLSYAAVVSILVIEPMLSYRVFSFGKLPSWLTSGLSVNIGLFPLLITYFNKFSPIGIIATVFASKAANVICLSGFAGWFVSFLPFGAYFMKIPAAVTSVAVTLLNKMSETGSGIPPPVGAFNVPGMSKFVIAIYYVVVLVLLNKKAFNYRKKRFIYVFFIIIIATVAATVHFRSTKVVFFDVGQGLSVLYKSSGVTGLIDTGEGKVDVSMLLYKQGVGGLDFVLLTHGHSDHSGGFEKVVSEHDVDVLFVPDNSADEGIVKACDIAGKCGTKIVRISDGYRCEIGDTVFKFCVNSSCFNKNGSGDINNSSVVMIAENSDGRAVFAGDIEEETENYMAGRGLFDDSEILQVAHHGSDTGSLYKNISIISPEYAIISVGENNNYGHPANGVLDTLSKVGANIKRSDLCGSVRITLRKGKVSTWQKLKTSKQ